MQDSVEVGMEEELPSEEDPAHSKGRTNRSYTVEYKVRAVDWHRQYGENWSQSARYIVHFSSEEGLSVLVQ